MAHLGLTVDPQPSWQHVDGVRIPQERGTSSATGSSSNMGLLGGWEPHIDQINARGNIKAALSFSPLIVALVQNLKTTLSKSFF